MRYLNKIVFINSAHVRHEVIRLDGNVHFIGTQGVGKSTLLRAILFFYNADKQHLGIRQGQQSFDEYYFPNANSYIVYEVAREHGAYSILVYRYQGRAVFRFIDAPYSDRWLVNEQGEVSSDWVTIRQRIATGGVDISAVVDRYEMYRDILFGNTHDRSHKFDKYALVESSKYQNIPRSIQNVFLNSKLDADFVKDTIIHSMTDGETALSLQAFRSLIKKFETDYSDIHGWYEKDKSGEIPVRVKANALIERYREVVAIEHQMVQIWKQLNTAVAEGKEQLPAGEEQLRLVREKIAKLTQQLHDLQSDFDKEKDRINRHIGELGGKLNTVREKRKKYETLHIEQLLERAKTEPTLKNTLEQERAVYDHLVKQYASIEDKYKQLRQSLENAHAAFETTLQETFNNEQSQLQMQREKLTAEKEKAVKKVRAAYNEGVAQIDERLEALNREREQQQITITRIQCSHPMQEAIAACEKELQDVTLSEKRAEERLSALDSEIARLRSEATMTQQNAQSKFNLQKSEITAALAQKQERLHEVEKKLSNYSGSLYEWLTHNKPDWEQTIGKVVAEDSVLYQTGLQPTLVEGKSLYGVAIDCNAVEPTHHSPNDYRREQKELNEQIEAARRQLTEIEQAQEAEDKRIRAKLAKDLTPLSQEKTALRVELEALPGKRRIKQSEITRLGQQEKELIAQRVAEKEEEVKTLITRILSVKEEKKQKLVGLEKEEARLEKERKDKLKPYEDRLTALKSSQEQQRMEAQQRLQEQLSALQREYNNELAGNGADTTMIAQQQAKIQQIEARLQQIKSEYPTVVAYRNDEEEWFSQESAFTNDKKQWEEKLSLISRSYQDKQERYRRQSAEYRTEEATLEKRIQHDKDGLEQYRRFVEVEKGVPEALQYETRTNATNKDIQTLLSELKGAVRSREMTFQSLKMAVNRFNSHFNSDNLFSFNTLPAQDEDYIAIATNLEEFIAQNKIEEYRVRTNALYRELIQRIAREVGHLTQYKAEVDKIIQEINRDFAEKRFAGVIRAIELRSEQTNDKMMQLLQSLKQFTEENALSIGEVNLFSGEDRNEVNEKVVDYLSRLMRQLQNEPGRTQISIGDTFCLQFRVRENDNDTGWVERINNVGSDGTDILVKAMINIMLINVFKKRATHGKDDFVVHCMMDEIGKLHPDNIHGILQFANSRNIYLVNGSPTTENAYDYKYTYLLEKGANAYTKISCLSIVHQTMEGVHE